jgi:2-iminobutanoate/2-iminopropanoate deaminase
MPNRLLVLLAAVSVTFLVSCAPPQPSAAPSPDVEYLTSEALAGLPFSEAVRVGNLMFLAGQTGTDPVTRQLVEGGIDAETRQTMNNLKDVLERNGATMDDVVKCTVILLDISEWGAMNEVYRTFFTEHFPARTSLGTSGLAGGARVEIECIAAV